MQTRVIEGALVLVLFLGYLVIWKLKQKYQSRRFGVDPEVLYNDTRPTQQYFAKLSRLLAIFIFILIVFHMLDFQNLPGFYRIHFFDRKIFDYVGFAVGILGLLICLTAQIEMGNSWRVGIDRERKTELVTTGIYRFVRNPTYTGLFILCVGVWMIFPTTIILCWALVFVVSIEYQVRIEEEFLSEIHGGDYIHYYLVTKRYLPFFY
jgi:protein-S-isoprenylcysteine O-methyltransferase Ste14